MNIHRAVVIGAGTMGNGIAQVIGMSDIPVQLVDIHQDQLDRALKTIESNLNRMAKKDKLTVKQVGEALGCITLSTEFNTSVKEADIVIEAVNENFDLKKTIFRSLDDAAPDHCILASNTSSISISRLAGITSRPEKVIGMHFFNPVPVMTLVEIVKGYETSGETYQAIVSLTDRLGKKPVPVNDYPGFVSNRVLMPMINEAIFCVHEGIAEPEHVDNIMMLGMAHPMGPLRLADFIGLDVCLDILRVLHEGFGDSKYRPCPLLVKMVHAGKLGDKTGEGFYTYQ